MGIGFFLFCFANIDKPSAVVFDEFHYVPAARELAHIGKNSNWEHPVFGKLFIALGMRIFGDNPIGWRFFSAVAGGILISFFMQCLYLITKRTHVALIAGMLAMFSGVIYVHSRTALLEIYLWTPLVIAVYFYLKQLLESQNRTRNLLWAIFFAGTAAAAKWSGLYLLLTIGVFEICLNYLQSDLLKPSTWIKLSQRMALILVGTLVTYFFYESILIFVSNENYDLLKIFTMQKDMFNGQIQVGVKTHSYQSAWYTWPLMLRPIWYYFQNDNNVATGIMLVGNPVVFWLMLLSVLFYTQQFFVRVISRHKASPEDLGMMFLLVMYYTMFGIWAVAPRSLTFFYYYVPAAIPAIGILAHHLCRFRPTVTYTVIILAFLAFLLYLPVYSAMAIPFEQLHIWAPFLSWI